MIFFNVNIVENDNICNTFRLKCDGDLPLVKEEKRRLYEVTCNRNAKK